MEKVNASLSAIPSKYSALLYLKNMKNNKVLLWCYLIWYLSMLSVYFISAPSMWVNSTGVALIVGYALVLSTGGNIITRIQTRLWETLRLFFCPFLVSSFTAMTHKHDFSLIFSPKLHENLLAIGFCALFTAIIILSKKMI